MKNKLAIACVIGCFAILSACGQTTSEKIHKQLESSITEEKEFNESQKKVAKLEKEEQKIFEKIVDFNMDEFKNVKKQSKKAIENIDKRSSEIDKEKSSIESSNKKFKKVDKLIKKLEDKSAKKQGEKMSKAMEKRYKTYESLNKEYNTSLKHEKKFYELLGNKDTKSNEVDEYLEKLNTTYVKIIEKNKQFNEETNKYNGLKDELYEKMNLDEK